MLKTFFKVLNNIFESIENILMYVSMTAAAIMMFFISIDAILRYAFNAPITGVYEITEDYLMVALVFLAMSYTYKTGGHVRVTMFLRFIPRGILAPMEAFFNVLALIFFALLTYGGWQVFLRAFRLGEFATSILRYPLAPAYFLIPLGSFFLCIRLLIAIFSLGKAGVVKPVNE